MPQIFCNMTIFRHYVRIIIVFTSLNKIRVYISYSNQSFIIYINRRVAFIRRQTLQNIEYFFSRATLKHKKVLNLLKSIEILWVVKSRRNEKKWQKRGFVKKGQQKWHGFKKGSNCHFSRTTVTLVRTIRIFNHRWT